MEMPQDADENGWDLATEKTVVVLLSRTRISREIEVTDDAETISTKTSVKYFGV